MRLTREQQYSIYLQIKDKFEYKNSLYIKEYCEKVSLQERNNFSDDIFIVVAGHQTYQEDLINFYKGIKNVIFVLDNGESQEKKNNIINNGFDYIVCQEPASRGFGNVNIQCVSSLAGVKHAKEKGAKYILRMRSDKLMVQLHKFLNVHDFSRLGTISIALNTPKHNHQDDFDGWNNVAFTKNNILGSNTSKLGTDYMLDYCLSGPIEDMLCLFDFYEDYSFYAPAEHKILLNFLIKKQLPLDNSYESLKKQLSLMLPVFVENNIEFLSLKQGYHNWTKAMSLQPYAYGV